MTKIVRIIITHFCYLVILLHYLLPFWKCTFHIGLLCQICACGMKGDKNFIVFIYFLIY
jgi:hypothetical protein